jgi:hypothetical protein
MTAIPKPTAVLMFLESAKNVHIPKKNASAIFSMKIAFTKRLM